VSLDDLPMIDEHSIDVEAQPDAVFHAVRRRFARVLTGPVGAAFSRLWGCDPPNAFEVVEEDQPRLIVVAGRHRFSRYGIIFRITPTASGSRLSAESRAEFPGVSGQLYKTAVIGTRGHVVATQALLRHIAKRAGT
jgi:hypothetical protein